MPAVDDLRGGLNSFPDKASVEKLRYYGIRTVVLHLKMPALPAATATRSRSRPTPPRPPPNRLPGLGVTRRRVGSLVIYEIGPGPNLHGTDG